MYCFQSASFFPFSFGDYAVKNVSIEEEIIWIKNVFWQVQLHIWTDTIVHAIHLSS